MKRLKEQHGIHKIILTADRGLNSKENLAKIRKLGYDYVMAYKIRIATKEIKSLVLDQNGYTKLSDGYFLKQSDLTTKVKQSGKAVEFTDQFILTYSTKRAQKDRKDRERLIEKAKKLSASKSLLKTEMKKGGKKYIQLRFDDRVELECDETKAAYDAQFDGYYGIVCSDPRLTPKDIVKAYSGLWKIEESFRVMKTNLEARPIYVWTEESIEGHFVICYLTLVLQRYLEYKRKEKGLECSTEEIQRTIESAMISVVRMRKPEVYLKNQNEDTFDAMLKALGKMPIPTSGLCTKVKL